MRELSYHDFTATGRPNILEGTINLTYRCNLRCIHCYTDCGFDHSKELPLKTWKKIVDQMCRQGCFWLTISGGEPLLYKDFLPLYLYAWKKGMKITLFTNATMLSPEIIRMFRKYRPFSVEVSFYGASPRVYESITGVRGSFAQALGQIRKLVACRTPVIIKTVGLRQNKKEIARIKSLSEKLLGPGKFKFDSFITPRLNGDTSVLKYRLTPRQIVAIEAEDPQMAAQRLKEYDAQEPLPRPAYFLYQCVEGVSSFSIDPDGRLKICALSRRPSFHLGTVSLKAALSRGIQELRDRRFSTHSKCRCCSVRGYCYFCPPRAFLETGREEAGSPYFCLLAKERKEHYESLASRRRG